MTDGPRSRLLWTLGLTVGAWAAVAAPAAAYVDPGSGTFLFQALIAGAMAAGMTVKVFWRRIRGLLPGRRQRSDEPAGRDGA